jgi:hypothetical protein
VTRHIPAAAVDTSPVAERMAGVSIAAAEQLAGGWFPAAEQTGGWFPAAEQIGASSAARCDLTVLSAAGAAARAAG